MPPLDIPHHLLSLPYPIYHPSMLLCVMMIFDLPFGPYEGASSAKIDPSGGENLVVQSKAEHPNTLMGLSKPYHDHALLVIREFMPP